METMHKKDPSTTLGMKNWGLLNVLCREPCHPERATRAEGSCFYNEKDASTRSSLGMTFFHTKP